MREHTDECLLMPMKKDTTIPKVDCPTKSDGQVIHQASQEDIRLAAVQKSFYFNVIREHDIINLSFSRWLMTIEQRYLQAVDSDSNISWVAYHASHQTAQDSPPTLGTMLPLFNEDSKSVAMIRHSMDVIKQVVQKLNPDQVPVITLDQPLAKREDTVELARAVWRKSLCDHPGWIAH